MNPIPLEAITLLGEGRLIEAIKVVRRAEGLGQRAARKRVDAHLAQEPLLRVQIETQLSARRRKIFFWFVLADLAIVAAFVYWFFN